MGTDDIARRRAAGMQAMKILIVMSNPYPGTSAGANHMHRMSQGLRRAGHEPLIVAPRLPDESIPLDGSDSEGISYASFSMPRTSRSLPYHPHWSAALRPRLTRKLVNVLAGDHFDAAVLHGESWWALDPARQICQQLGVPVVPYAMEWFPPKLRRVVGLSWLDQWLLRRLTYASSDGLIGISRIWSDVAAAHGLPFVTVPAFSPCADQLPQITNQPHQGFRLLFSGTWVRRELPGTMIRGIELAAARGVDVELVAIGNIGHRNEERSALRQLARSPSRQRVRLTGWLSDQAMQCEIAAADAFVLLRNDDRECRALFPTRLPEYLAAGKPLIVSNAGDLALHLRHGHSAYLLPPGDCPEALAGAIEFLATHPKEARAIGLGARDALSQSFSQDMLALQAAEFISKLGHGTSTEAGGARVGTRVSAARFIARELNTPTADRHTRENRSFCNRRHSLFK
jgi:glycosyltransferase involved in cell wall biosynthesis